MLPLLLYSLYRGIYVRYAIVHRGGGIDTSTHFIWSGFAFSLYRDSAEQYWHNLIGHKPSLYVVCREDDCRELNPYLVTIDYDEAGAAPGNSSCVALPPVSLRVSRRPPYNKFKNSCRVLISRRKRPNITEVVICEFCFSTPRIFIHRCSASIITPTPLPPVTN